ncbi:MAG: type IV pili methyl-accepting chemotaxis transducer N-terminal domain-containing protein [Hydrogenophilaceae bacterium]
MPPSNAFHPPSWPLFSRSLLLRIGGAIAAISMLAVLGMAVSGLVAESTQGSGEAINRAGSLRMQSWQMTSLYLAAHAGAAPGATAQLAQAIERFDATLADGAIKAMLPQVRDADLGKTYRQVESEWREQIRPRFLVMALGQRGVASPEEGDALLEDTSRFVGRINLLVKQMEDSTEAKILVMRVVLGVALILTVLVVLLTVWLIHTHLVQPLRALLGLTTSVGKGDLTARTEYTGEDELGQVGSAFNRMTEDLAKLYQDLEERVRQKTAELTRSNQSLELLYHSIARLHGAPPGKAVYLAVLHDIEEILELGHGIICLGEHGGDSGVAVASTMLPGDANPCNKSQCLWCHGSDQTRFSIADGFRQHLTLPLADAEQQYGVLILEIPAGRHLEAWQVQLLEALSRHIGVAIGAEQRIEQSRRLALLEERAVIARELHDSLAQSLAYMKIQVSRMKAALRDDKGGEASGSGKLETVLEEMREGLNAAYHQLRELLATFRLKMEDAPLAKVLSDTVNEFAERGGLPIALDLAMADCQLSPNEEIHVLHIVREALSNVLRHAHASRARLALTCDGEGRVEVMVEDDGKGIVKPTDMHHYGMTIMEERARTLHGNLHFEPRPGGGSRVVLHFTANGKQRGKTHD